MKLFGYLFWIVITAWYLFFETITLKNPCSKPLKTSADFYPVILITKEPSEWKIKRITNLLHGKAAMFQISHLMVYLISHPSIIHLRINVSYLIQIRFLTYYMLSFVVSLRQHLSHFHSHWIIYLLIFPMLSLNEITK